MLDSKKKREKKRKIEILASHDGGKGKSEQNSKMPNIEIVSDLRYTNSFVNDLLEIRYTYDGVLHKYVVYMFVIQCN